MKPFPTPNPCISQPMNEVTHNTHCLSLEAVLLGSLVRVDKVSLVRVGRGRREVVGGASQGV